MNSHGLNVISRTEVNRSDRLLLIRGAETTLFHERRHGIGGLSRNNNVYGSVTKRLHDIGKVFDTACTVQGFDTATRADVEGSIEAN